MAITPLSSVPPAPEPPGPQSKRSAEAPTTAPTVTERQPDAPPKTDHVTLHDSALRPLVDERFDKARQGEMVEFEREQPPMTSDTAIEEAKQLYDGIVSSREEALTAQSNFEPESAQALMAQAG